MNFYLLQENLFLSDHLIFCFLTMNFRFLFLLILFSVNLCLSLILLVIFQFLILIHLFLFLFIILIHLVRFQALYIKSSFLQAVFIDKNFQSWLFGYHLSNFNLILQFLYAFFLVKKLNRHCQSKLLTFNLKS